MICCTQYGKVPTQLRHTLNLFMSHGSSRNIKKVCTIPKVKLLYKFKSWYKALYIITDKLYFICHSLCRTVHLICYLFSTVLSKYTKGMHTWLSSLYHITYNTTWKHLVFITIILHYINQATFLLITYLICLLLSVLNHNSKWVLFPQSSSHVASLLSSFKIQYRNSL